MQTQNDGLEILRLMRAGVSHTFVVKVRSLEIPMRALSSIEMINAAKLTMRRIQLEERTPIEETLLTAMVKLELAATPEDGGTSKLPVKILEMMTPAEVDSIFSQWLAECEKLNPSMETMSEESLIALVDEVKKSPLGVVTALSSRSFTELVNISRYLMPRE